ncbi:MAG: hypothetical protein ABIF09_05595 [Gemmatimonadota bacterium]
MKSGAELLQGLKRQGGRFAFEFFLEMYHDQFIGILRRWLGQFDREDVARMVSNREFPDVPVHALREVKGVGRVPGKDQRSPADGVYRRGGAYAGPGHHG